MFALYHNSGFYLTPITKGILGTLVLSSVAFIVPLQAYRYWFLYTYSTIFEKHQFQKFLACRSVFLDPKDLICAAILLYHFRIFERRFGSRKYASYLLGSMALSSLFEMAAIYTLHNLDLPIKVDPLPSGPQGPVFALFVPYFYDIPRVAVTSVLGIPVTGKSLIYIIGLQMASSSAESMLLATCGLLSGVLYRENFMYVQDVCVVPGWLGALTFRLLGWLVSSPPPTDTTVPMGATLEIQRQQQMEVLEQQLMWAQLQQQRPRNGGFGFFGHQVNHNGAAPNANIPVAPVQPPPDDQVQRLVEMGFNRDSVMNALRVTNNDITMATNILLHES